MRHTLSVIVQRNQFSNLLSAAEHSLSYLGPLNAEVDGACVWFMKYV